MNRNVLLGASLSILAAACSSSSGGDSPGDAPVARSEAQRVTAPSVPDADAAELQKGDTAFATDVYKALAADPSIAGDNVFFSPHSISVALAMTYAGARTHTAAQMASALHFTLPEERLHPALDALDLGLASRGAGAKGQDGQPFRLRVASSLWGSPVDAFEAPFLDTLAQSYGAGVRLTDFASDPEAARKAINGWVDGETEHKIAELLPEKSLDASTRLVLVNAVYFNAAWSSKFQKEATQPGTFHGIHGDAAAQMMAQSSELPYAKGDGWQTVALPYDGNELSMIAVLPSDLGAFEQGFDGDEANAIAGALQTKPVNLSMPKFELKGSTFSVRDTLAKLGMTDAFAQGADFSGMTKTEPLHISDVLHQAFIAVDENGTEAAAATAVVAVGTAAPIDPPVTLTLDKPFVFFIRDNATGAVVFLGRLATL